MEVVRGKCVLLQKVPLTLHGSCQSPESRNPETAIPEGCLALLPGDTLSLTCEPILQNCDKDNSNILNTVFGGGGSGVSTGLR